MTPHPGPFPFDAVVGQEDAKLALRLAASDPGIGGVLLRGEKGSAKTTLARGLAGLLGEAPFVELPLGATEDRVIGTLDTRAALVGGEMRFQPGLLAAADGGVLYVDEINLLADHLIDVLLDVTVSGENVVERDGVSHRHPARFVLVGSMNPEEGELRPQLLDRFGLCVDVSAPREIADRVESVRRRLAFDAGTAPAAGHSSLVGAIPAPLPTAVLETASGLALAVGAEGLRADLTLCRAASALAGLDERDKTELGDLRRVAPLVLAHRCRRGPFDPPVLPSEELDDLLDQALPGTTPRADHHHPSDGDTRNNDSVTDGNGSSDTTDSSDNSDGDLAPKAREAGDLPSAELARDTPLVLGRARPAPLPPSRSGPSARGRLVADRAAGPSDPVAVLPTVRALAAQGSTRPGPDDLRAAVRLAPRLRTIVLCVDLSGSMGAPERAGAASGTVLGLLDRAYQQRDRVALVTFRGDGATLVLSPTASVEVARNRLDHLTTGGATPLADGINLGLQVAERATGSDPLLVLLTDGRATGQADGFDRACQAAAAVRRAGVTALVLDCETGQRPLGLAAVVAEAMGARHVLAADLNPRTLTHAIQTTASSH